MSKVRKIYAVAVAIVALAIAFGAGMGAGATAGTGGPVTASEVRKLRADIAAKRTISVRPEVAAFVLDSTVREAARKRCPYDRLGNVVSATGENRWASWYGTANPEKTGLDSVTRGEKRSAGAKLSYAVGYCGLDVRKSDGNPYPSLARKGAKDRVNAALRKM